MASFVQVEDFTVPDSGWVVRRRERVPAPPERVWRALVDPKELAHWWCDEAEVDTRREGAYRFRGRTAFREGDGRILDLVENERLEFLWRLDGADTTVRYELAGLLDITELTVTQSASSPPVWPTSFETPSRVPPTWWHVALPALRAYIEGGRAELRLDYERLRNHAADEALDFAIDVFTFPWIIWDKLTNPAQLDRWIAHGATVESRAGGRFDFGPESDVGPTRVIELDPLSRLKVEWRWSASVTSTVEWRIEDAEESTRVTFSDSGPWPAEMAREEAAVRWATLLLDLKQMSQRGVTPREYQG